MNLLSCVDKVGKFAYFEPNDIERKGLSNEIFNSYEDYCISVSLLVQIGNRNSCGIGDNKIMYFTSENGTISFMGGMGGDSKGPGYLTSNFTEVNNVPGSSGNRECLGIESIDISYQSWFFPVVTIKFVDVRGSSLMNPSENSAREAMETHPQDISQGAGGSFYKALFMYPRPIFKLSVKGFYGREVTYDLTIRDSKIDFDSKSGNFSCTVNFIGYMYGVYTDIPMTYISVAPYIDKSGYWDSRVANGYFTIDGNPILTFPELKNRLYLLMNKDNDKLLETEVGVEYKKNRENIEELDKIIGISDNSYFPSNEWTQVSDYYVFVKEIKINEKELRGVIKSVEDSVKTTANILKKNGISTDFLTSNGNDWKSCFVTVSDSKTNDVEYYFKPQYLVKGVGWSISNLFRFKSDNDKNNSKKLFKITEVYENKDYLCYEADDDKVKNKEENPSDFNRNSVEELNKLLKSLYEKVNKDIDINNKNNKEKSYIVAFVDGNFKKEAIAKRDILLSEQESLNDRLQEEKLELIRQTIGYDLTIKNVFKTVFAHLDSFVNFFYNALDEIRNLPDSDRKVSSIPNYYKLDVSRTNPDLKLSPFPLVVKQTGDNNDIIYPDEKNISMRLEECDFTERLINATEQYNNSYSNLKDAVIEALENAKRGSNLSATVKGFIPITYYDMVMNDGGNYNPYKSVAESSAKDRPYQIIYTAIMRLVYDSMVYGNDILSSLASIEARNLLSVYSGFDETERNSLENVKNDDKIIEQFLKGDVEEFSYRKNGNQGLFEMAPSEGGYYSYLAIENGEKNVLPIGKFGISSVRYDYQNEKYSNNKNYLVLNKDISKQVQKPDSLGYFEVYENVDFFDQLEKNIWNSDDNNSRSEKQILCRRINERNLKTNENPYMHLCIATKGKNNELDILSDKKFWEQTPNVKIAAVKTDTGSTTYKGVEQLTDGIMSYPNGGHGSIFLWDEFYGDGWTNEGRAYIYLYTLLLNEDFRKIRNNAEALKVQLLQEGAYYWFSESTEMGGIFEKYKTIEEDELPIGMVNGRFTDVKLIPQNNGDFKYCKAKDYFGDEVTNVSEGRKQRLKEYFSEFVNGMFGDIYSSLSVKNEYTTQLERYNDTLLGFYRTIVTVIDPSDVEWKTSGYDKVKSALKTFLNTILSSIKRTGTVSLPTTSYGDQLAQTNYAKNDDFNLSTYLNLKNIYDKWFACNNRQTWLIDGDEANNFLYLDSYYNDIGDKFHINLEMLSDMISDQLPTARMYDDGETVQYEGKSVYEFLSEICEKNSLTFLALPQRFGLNVSTEDMKQAVADMFTPIPFIKKNLSSAVTHTYVCLYSYRPSQHLAGGFDGFTDDSFDIAKGNKENLPIGLQDITGSQIPAFGVTFGKMNQSYFKDISFDMSDMQNTEETIATTQMIAAKGSDGTPRKVTGYGQDLYRIYSNYSYKCEVEMMGDAQIMPLMYFQLNNIPMWRGAYMIISVNHSIRANSMTTRFKGVRMNSNTIPYVKGGLMWVDQTGTVKSMIGGGGGGFSIGTVPYTGEGVSSSNAGSILTAREVRRTDRVVEGFNVQELIHVNGTDYSDPNITKEKPIIVLTPAHTPNHPKKADEYRWSEKLIKQYIIPKLREMKFYDGTKYADHIEDASGTEYGTDGYSCKIAKECVKRYGSDRVISIVPHWNGGGGSTANYYAPFVNYLAPREDSVRFSAIFRDNAIIAESDKRFILETNAKPMIRRLDTSPQGRTDPAVWLNCACVLTENWFKDYVNKQTGVTGNEWLHSEDGLNLISDLHVKSIKEYIDSLHKA